MNKTFEFSDKGLQQVTEYLNRIGEIIQEIGEIIVKVITEFFRVFREFLLANEELLIEIGVLKHRLSAPKTWRETSFAEDGWLIGEWLDQIVRFGENQRSQIGSE